jgi:arabinose-5-phosphate isomerase
VHQSLRETMRVLDDEAQALDDVQYAIMNDLERFYSAARWIASSAHVITTGVGKSGLIAQRGAALLASVGVPASFMHPIDALHGDSGRIQTDDCIIALSHSGETDEVCHFIQHVNTWTDVITITSGEDSRLSKLADMTLAYPRRHDGGAHGFLPTVSCAAQTGYLDSLAVFIATDRGVDPEMFLRHHPGGNLGRTLNPEN